MCKTACEVWNVSTFGNYSFNNHSSPERWPHVKYSYLWQVYSYLQHLSLSLSFSRSQWI